MSDLIHAPFTAEQVARLNEFQKSDYMHPFTCGRRSEPGHRKYAIQHRQHDHGILIATEQGWICPVCDYKQDWAHAWMAEPLPDVYQQLKTIFG